MKLEDLLALQKSERHVAMRGSKRSRKRGESRRSYQSLRNPILTCWRLGYVADHAQRETRLVDRYLQAKE